MIDLINGDCLEVMEVLKNKNVKVDSIITDIPYGTTKCGWDSVIPLDKMWKAIKPLCKDNTSILLFGAEPFSSKVRLSNQRMYRYDWIWQKTMGSNFLCLKKQPFKLVENIMVFYKKQPTYNPQMLKGKPYTDKRNGIRTSGRQQNYGIKHHSPKINTGYRYPNNVIKFSNGNNKTLHPTQKPIALMEYLINTYTNKNDIVLDFTMGSGSTGVACKHLERNFIGIELDKTYYDIAERRIAEELL